MQKRAAGGAGLPHEGQRRSSRAPHAIQKRAPAGFSLPHAAQASALMAGAYRAVAVHL
jgi:hypothetical protein